MNRQTDAKNKRISDWKKTGNVYRTLLMQVQLNDSIYAFDPLLWYSVSGSFFFFLFIVM